VDLHYHIFVKTWGIWYNVDTISLIPMAGSFPAFVQKAGRGLGTRLDTIIIISAVTIYHSIDTSWHNISYRIIS